MKFAALLFLLVSAVSPVAQAQGGSAGGNSGGGHGGGTSRPIVDDPGMPILLPWTPGYPPESPHHSK